MGGQSEVGHKLVLGSGLSVITMTDSVEEALDCARTVHERFVLSLLGLAFERKQIPRFVVNASS